MKPCLLAALLLTGCSAPEVKPPPPISALTFRIEIGESVCGATAIGPSKLLTASHCMTGYPLITIDGTAVGVRDVVHDGRDHAIVTVTRTFTVWAEVGPPPKVGDVVEYYGNPLMFRQLYRRGYVSAVDSTATVLDVNGYHGDSGAGVFNTHGQVVGVISGMTKGEFRVVAMFPFAFKPEELL